MTTTIDGADVPPAAPGPPGLAVRLVITEDGRTRRVDLAVGGTESVAVEDGVETTFPTARLWPVVRDLLPDHAHLRADPASRPSPTPRPPGADLADDVRAFVAVATVVEEQVSVRTWLATGDEVWSVSPLPDGTNDVRPAAPGAVADLLVWDVTAALGTLVHRLEERAS